MSASYYRKFHRKAYDEGGEACREHDGNPKTATNPYEEKSDEWKAWNKGWNDAFKEGWMV